MEKVIVRPKLFSFRVEAFSGENRTEGNGSPWTLEVEQKIQVGLAVPVSPGAPIQALVKIELQSEAKNESEVEQKAFFKGEYLGKFNFPEDANESNVVELIDQESYQYVLVAQVFPLAMTHLRRELLAMGFDGKQLPLGI